MNASGKELVLLQDSLLEHSRSLIPILWSKLDVLKASDKRILSIASTLVRYDPRNPDWAAYLEKVSEAVTLASPDTLDSWIIVLSPIRDELVVRLTAICADKKRPENQRAMALRAIRYYERKE
jgi:hypothetical protein